jgi:hypothetical protein
MPTVEAFLLFHSYGMEVIPSYSTAELQFICRLKSVWLNDVDDEIVNFMELIVTTMLPVLCLGLQSIFALLA